MKPLREDSPFKIGWDVLICGISLTTGLVLPLELLQGFSYGHALTPWWAAFSLIGLVDIALTFVTSFERNGLIVTDMDVIRRHYLRGWFWLDLVANLPFLLLHDMRIQSGFVAMLPLLRLPQLYRITARWEDIQLLDSAILRVIRYVMSIMLITNWISCLWLYIGISELSPQGWIQRLALARNDFFGLYLHSLYWTVTTLATVGYGDITPKTTREIIAAILMMITGATLYAFAVGNVVSIINSFDGGRGEYRKRQSAITGYLTLNGVDAHTIRRVRRFNDYQWARTRGFRPQEFLEELPPDLRGDVMIKILQETTENVPLFAAAPPALRKRLLLLLQPVTFPPGAVVLDRDEMGDAIVFITKKMAELQS